MKFFNCLNKQAEIKTFECFEGKFIYDAKRTLRLMINLKVILNLN